MNPRLVGEIIQLDLDGVLISRNIFNFKKITCLFLILKTFFGNDEGPLPIFPLFYCDIIVSCSIKV